MNVDMIDEEHLTDIDVSDINEDNETENYTDIETNIGECSTLHDSDNILNSEEQSSTEKIIQILSIKTESAKSTRLPMARIKNIMKTDPDVSVISGDAVFLVTKATELFLETIAKETYFYTSTNKRKIISKKDLDVIIDKVDCLCFLEGVMDF